MARERSASLDIIPLIYQDPSEVTAMLTDQAVQADVILFTGFATYHHIRQSRTTAKPLLYVPHTSASLYALLQICRTENRAWPA